MKFITAEEWRTSIKPTDATHCGQCGEAYSDDLFWFGDGQCNWSDEWYCWTCVCDGLGNGVYEAALLEWRVHVA